jgi:hypothetical protein
VGGWTVWLQKHGCLAVDFCTLASDVLQVVSVHDGLPTWIAELMVSRGNIHEAIDYVKQIEQDIQQAVVIE